MIFILFVISLSAFSNIGNFSGRVVKVNRDIGLVRVLVDFNNMKYINKKDKVDFLSNNDESRRCSSWVVGKSNNYILFRIPNFEECLKSIYIVESGYMRFYGHDLVNNIKMGKKLIGILLKKRLAYTGILKQREKDLHSYIEKINAINARYKIIRDKLNAEWQGTIEALEMDRVNDLKEFKDVETKIVNMDKKLEQYRIEETNLKEDKWSLDSRLYYKK